MKGVLVLLLLTAAVASADYRDDIYSPTSYVRSTGSSVIRRGSDGYVSLYSRGGYGSYRSRYYRRYDDDDYDDDYGRRYYRTSYGRRRYYDDDDYYYGRRYGRRYGYRYGGPYRRYDYDDDRYDDDRYDDLYDD
ncbi:probable peroxisomal membrane protein PEX13 [Amphibalanus amphitrite]|uniref:probable peroxisomal membrane protein PEX13 n=1 Tax=Amphibalanus amphitrite TaxID=1232801 RepID=UPI001C91E5C6|nr:probable peroxisomal membrane protein PEX13 [Amphibalanus amphitrite]XP_043208814.1 probable peroxisomal membrane protein PEX13 [Amphibalanus amphitrite]